MTKTLILDKDLTLVTPASGAQFPTGPEDQRLLNPAIPGLLERWRAGGYTLAIATNQGGVASGYKTLDDAINETIFAMQLCDIEYAMLAHTYENKGYGEAYWIDLSDGGSYTRPMTNREERKMAVFSSCFNNIFPPANRIRKCCNSCSIGLTSREYY